MFPCFAPAFGQEDEEDALQQQVGAQQAPLEGAPVVFAGLVLPPAVVQVIPRSRFTPILDETDAIFLQEYAVFLAKYGNLM